MTLLTLRGRHMLIKYKEKHETFELEHYETQEEVRRHIQECEGKHTQQVAYSSFHDALTQICFTCQRIRTNL